jgi:hypothetical protein
MTTMLASFSQETKLLPAPASVKALLAESRSCGTATEGVFSVLALYGGQNAHAEAIRFAEFLAHNLAPDVDMQTSEWSFAELQHLRPGQVTAELAEQTDVLLLVTEEHQELPVPIRRWIASWLRQARPSCALVCLVGSALDHCPVWPADRNLRNACAEAGVSFFASSFHSKATAPLQQCCPAYPALSLEISLSGISHWGINE